MRRLFAISAVLLSSSACICACGSADVRTSSTGPRSVPATSTSAADTPVLGGVGRQEEARKVLDFGRAADSSNKRVITALVERYLQTEVTENGAGACTMLYSTYAEAVPEDYGTSPPGPAYAQGKTCPVVMTLVFKHYHQQIVARRSKLRVSQVRISGRQGVAVLNLDGTPAREIRVQREGRIWRVVALMDNELP